MTAQILPAPFEDATPPGRSAAHSVALMSADDMFRLMDEIGGLASRVIQSAPEELRQGLAAQCLASMQDRVRELDFGASN